MSDDLPRIDEAARPRWTVPPSVRESREGMGGQLIQVHLHLREELRRLLAVVDDVVAEKQDAEIAKPLVGHLSRSLNYVSLGSMCSGYCSMLTMHHSIEDRSVFPELQRIEPSLKPVVTQLHAEHEDHCADHRAPGGRAGGGLPGGRDGRSGPCCGGEGRRGGPWPPAFIAPGLRRGGAGPGLERVWQPVVSGETLGDDAAQGFCRGAHGPRFPASQEDGPRRSRGGDPDIRGAIGLAHHGGDKAEAQARLHQGLHGIDARALVDHPGLNACPGKGIQDDGAEAVPAFHDDERLA